MEKGFSDRPLIVGVVRVRQVADSAESVAELVGFVGVDEVLEKRFFRLAHLELDVIDAETLAPLAILRKQKRDESLPVVEVLGLVFGRSAAVGAEGDGGVASVVSRVEAELRGEFGELMQHARGHGVCGPREGGTDDGFEGAFELGADVAVESFFVERVGAERKEVRPLVALLKHAGKQ